MYIPSSFAESDPDKLCEFIERHSFATLVSHSSTGLMATHMPLLLDRSQAGPQRLVGHLARANPHGEQADGQRVLAIFHGPHAYISPSWYEAVNVVPTWNYVAVHVDGVLRLVHDRVRLMEIVRRYVETYESTLALPWSLEHNEGAFVERLLDAIVGFTIEIDSVEGKWKLSQNHDRQRRERVIRALHSAGDENRLRIADLMAETLHRDA